MKQVIFLIILCCVCAFISYGSNYITEDKDDKIILVYRELYYCGPYIIYEEPWYKGEDLKELCEGLQNRCVTYGLDYFQAELKLAKEDCL